MIPTKPTETDLQSLAIVKDLAFQEKRPFTSASRSVAAIQKVYEKYLKTHPRKLEHCRVIKDDSSGSVIGFIQLQMSGDVGDLSFPSDMRHKLLPGEAYVEVIACHPDHTGKGIGSKLLQWAFSYCEESGVKFLSLEVMAANKGAVRLYERKGFVSKPDPRTDFCEKICAPLFIFCFLGCRYCSLTYMEKSFPTSAGAVPMNMSR